MEQKTSPPRSAWPENDFSASTISSAQPTSAPHLSPQEMISSTNLYGCEFCSFFASDYEAVVIHEQQCAAAVSAPIDHSQVSTVPSPPPKPEPEQTDILQGLSLPVLHRAFTKLCPRHGTALGVAGFPRLLRLLQEQDPAVGCVWLELVELFEDDPSASNQLAGEAVMIDRPQFLYQLATIAKSYDTTATAAPTIATAHRPSPPNVYSPAAAQSMDWHSVHTPQASGATSRTAPNSAMSWSEQLEHAMTSSGEVTVAY